MTGSALRRRIKTEYETREGVRFFSEKALLFALLEKHSLPRDHLLVRGGEEIDEALCAALLADADRLLSGEPLQYYLGTAPFCGHDFLSDPGVLIPRPDTEILVREGLRHAPENALVFDFCCGSGCVGLSLLLARRDLSAALFDLSDEALELTKRNAARFSLEDRVTVEKLDVLSPAAREAILDSRPALVLANPPYLSTREMKEIPENVKREPPLALAGGEDGLVFYRAFAVLCRETKTPFLTEIGCGQAASVAAILEENGLRGSVVRDEGGRDRVVFAR